MATFYKASFSDGRTAARRNVQVRFAKEGLVVAGADGAVVASWPFENLRLVGAGRRDQPLRLTSKTNRDARLTVADQGFKGPLFRSAPHLRGGGRGGWASVSDWPWRHVALWGAGIAAVVAVPFVVLPRLAGPVAALIPAEWEVALGEELAGEFFVGACSGPAGKAALRRLANRLAATLDTPYTFKVEVVDSDDVNAFAAPGGFIVIFDGLLTSARSPDEVAGVLAHEMGHVVAHHGTEAVVRAVGLSLIFQIFVGDPSGLVGLGAAAGQFLIEMSYSRGDEAEADESAVEILTAADIRTGGFAAFLERLDREAKGQAAAFAMLSSHPLSGDRAEAIKAVPGGDSQAMSGNDWRALKSICR